VRAYGGTAAQCLRTASRRALVQLREAYVRAGFDDIGAVHAAIQAHGATPLEEHFDSNWLSLRLTLPQEAIEPLAERLRDATRDRVRLVTPGNEAR
jgi:putative IMPACT (imprinted ancient) family translation regulator